MTSEREAAGPRTRRGSPPGLVFYLVTLATILVVFEGTTQQAMWTILAGGLAFLGVALAWLLRLLWAALRGRLRMSPRDALRWLGIPVLLGLAYVAVATGAATTVRFEASRGAMDALAADVMAGRWRVPGPVGLYSVQRIDDLDDSVRVVVGGVLWDDVGFEWFADPDMTRSRAEDRCRCEYAPLGGGWWRVTEVF